MVEDLSTYYKIVLNITNQLTIYLILFCFLGKSQILKKQLLQILQDQDIFKLGGGLLDSKGH